MPRRATAHRRRDRHPRAVRRELQGWRERLGDPNALRIVPHVTLLPPTPVDSEALAEIEEHLRLVATQIRAFDIRLRGSATFLPVSSVVFVPLVQGIAECEQLEVKVRSGPLCPRARLHLPPARHRRARPARRGALPGVDGAVGVRRVASRCWGFTLFEQGPDLVLAAAAGLHVLVAVGCPVRPRSASRGPTKAGRRSPVAEDAGSTTISSGRRWLAFPVRGDQEVRRRLTRATSRSLITYYAFFSIFPLLLALFSMLGFVLHGHPGWQTDDRGRALSNFKQFPLIKGPPPKHGSVVARRHRRRCSRSTAGSAVAKAAQNAWDIVYGVPRSDRPGFVPKNASRAAAGRWSAGSGFIATTLVVRRGDQRRSRSASISVAALNVLGIVVTLLLNTLLFTVLFRWLTVAR